MRTILEESGLEYTITIYPWPRAYDMALSQKDTLIYSIMRLPSREELFQWIPLDNLSSSIYLFQPGNRDIEVETLEDVKLYKVAVTRETASQHFLLSQGFVVDENLILLNKEEQISLMVGSLHRRVDFSPRDMWYQAWWQKTSGYPSDFWEKTILLFEKKLYMAFSKTTDSETVETVRRTVDRLHSSGKLEAIIEKYEDMYN